MAGNFFEHLGFEGEYVPPDIPPNVMPYVLYHDPLNPPNPS